jgi:hypothetical protein
VNVETYSSLLDEVKTVPEHQFSFEFDIFDYINDAPKIQNFLMEFDMHEDQEAGYIDLDGNERPDTGIFYDPNLDQGDELDYYIFNGVDYQWVSLGNPMELEEADIFYLANGTLKISFTENWYGTQRLLVEVRDSRGASIGTVVDVIVSSLNDPPMILAPIYWDFDDPAPELKGDIITCNEDEILNFTIKGQDLVEPEDPLRYSFQTNSTGEFFLDNDMGQFTFEPENNDVGDHILTFSLSDGTDIVTRDILIRVKNINDAPDIKISELPDAYEDEDYWFLMEAVDVDPTGDRLSWTLISEAGFLHIDERTGNISGRPGQEDVGNHYLIIKVNDGNGGEDTFNIYLKVQNTNDPPYIYNSPSTLFIDEDSTNYFSLEGWFDDPDVDEEISFSAVSNGPLSVNVIGNMTLNIVPPANWSGSSTINVTASDGVINVTDTLNVVVENINDAPFDPIVELHFDEVFEGDEMLVTASAEDMDIEYGDRLFFAWFSNVSGKLGEGNSIDLMIPAGPHMITLTVTDRSGDLVHYNFEVMVKMVPSNDTIDDDNDDDAAEEKDSGALVTVLAIVIPITILFLAAVGVILFLIMKRREEGAEETNPNGDNPPSG